MLCREQGAEMTVSIIVPVYNVAPYLNRCLESICAQSYPNIEILLINDGSTDASGEICRRAAYMDRRIRFIEQDNKGLSAARNTGLDAAHGNYILFVDGDDYISPFMVETLLYAIGEQDMAMCRYCMTDFLKVHENSAVMKSRIWTMDDYWKAYYNGHRRECVVVWNKLYKAELFHRYRFPEGRVHEDDFMISHIMQGKRTIALCNEVLYYYVQRPGSIMSSKRRNMDFPDAMEERIRIFHRNGNDRMARRSVLYALYDLRTGRYPEIQKEKAEERIYRLGMTLTKTPGFLIRLIRRRFLA